MSDRSDSLPQKKRVRLLLLLRDTSVAITITAQDSPKVTHPQEDTLGNGQGQELRQDQKQGQGHQARGRGQEAGGRLAC